MNRVIPSFFFVALIALPAFACAAPVIRTGNEVSLKEDQAVAGDFYALAGSVVNSAKVSGDSYMAAGSITQNGETTSDLVVAGGTIQLHAPVGDDVRAVGGQVVIGEHVSGDVVVLGGELVILSTAEIAGDVMFYGGTLSVRGPVKGAIYASAETIDIDAVIGKDVTVTAHKKLSLGEHSKVAGDLTYRSANEAERAIDSNVSGTYRRDDTYSVTESPSRPSAVPFFVLLFTGFVYRFLLGTRVAALLARSVAMPGHSALLGLATLVLAPVVIGLAFVSVLGILLGSALLFAYFAALALAFSFSGIVLGAFISRIATGQASYNILWITIGTAVLYALTFVPYVGLMAPLAVTLIVLGSFTSRGYEFYR